MKKQLVFVALITAVLAGCAYPVGPRESTGTLLGAGTGALIGSQFGSGEGRIVATAIGTLAGALIGQDIGRTLDRTDRLYMQQSAQRTLETAPTYQSGSWVNPDSGHSGTITPTRTYQNASGQYCREYQQTVIVAGREEQAYGRACRQPDGSWQISDASPAVGQVIRQPTVNRVVTPTVYQPVYRPVTYAAYGSGYYYPYPRYYSPGYLWPFTSISLSYGHFSGHKRYLHRGHYYGHRGGHHLGVRGRSGHRGGHHLGFDDRRRHRGLRR